MANPFELSYAAGGAGDALQELVVRRFIEALQRDQLEEESRHAREMEAQGRQQIGEQGRQFDANLNQRRVEQMGEAPVRQAGINLTKAQTGEVQRRPQAEQEDRRFREYLSRLGHDQNLTEIGTQGEQSRQNINLQGGWNERNAKTARDRFSVQPVIRPDGTQGILRVNLDTGEAMPIDLPDGSQAGRGSPMSAAMREDLATMATIGDLSQLAVETGTKNKWRGVGGMGRGSIGSFAAKQFGAGTPDEENLRNYLGNIQGTLAKLRGGASFTTHEKQMLEQYTPTINDDPMVIQSKLKALNEFIALKKKNMTGATGGPSGPANTGQFNTPKTGQRYRWVDGQLIAQE